MKPWNSPKRKEKKVKMSKDGFKFVQAINLKIHILSSFAKGKETSKDILMEKFLRLHCGDMQEFMSTAQTWESISATAKTSSINKCVN